MRIIIEMTEAEGRSTTIARETAAGETAQPPTANIDGGQPSDALLVALGKQPQPTTAPPASAAGATDAGQPAAWLLESVKGSQRLM